MKPVSHCNIYCPTLLKAHNQRLRKIEWLSSINSTKVVLIDIKHENINKKLKSERRRNNCKHSKSERGGRDRVVRSEYTRVYKNGVKKSESSQSRLLQMFHFQTDESFFAIPKRSKKNSKSSDRFWRLDFNQLEKKIIAKKGFSKNIVRLLKVNRSKSFLSLVV